MSNRATLLKSISKLTAAAKNSATHEERFEHLETIALLGDILKSVTNFETKLLADLDVD